MRIGGMSVKGKLTGRPCIVHVERASDTEAARQRGEEQEKAWLTAEAQRRRGPACANGLPTAGRAAAGRRRGKRRGRGGSATIAAR